MICMAKSKRIRFAVVIERDEDGYYVADVPALKGCHTQAKSPDGLMNRIKEVIELYLDSPRGRGHGATRLWFCH
jgi:predicted RNase H-like HicB family nuclease